jgi:integrase
MTISFFLRNRGKQKHVIFLQVCDSRFKGRRFLYSTGYSLIENHWDKRKSRAKLSTARGTEYEKLNQNLDHLEQLVIEFKSRRHQTKSLNKAELKAFILADGEQKSDDILNLKGSELFALWIEIINSTKNSSGESLASSTKQTKLQTLRLVKKFAFQKAMSLTSEDIDMTFYHEFDSFMKLNGLNGNSRGKHFKEIKATMREAIDRDYKVNMAFQKKSFKVIRTEPDSIFLNDEELKKIMQVKLNHTLEKRKDIFIMACFVGARHSDWHQIRNENIVIEKGKEILRIRQQKTNEITHVPVHPVVRMILNKYGDNLPKVISNQKFNEALKEICKAADLGSATIDKKLVDKWREATTHTARRSFATNAYLSRSMDVYQIMKCTGHKTETSFLRYLRLNGKDFAIQAADSSFFTNNSYAMVLAS